MWDTARLQPAVEKQPGCLPASCCLTFLAHRGGGEQCWLKVDRNRFAQRQRTKMRSVHLFRRGCWWTDSFPEGSVDVILQQTVKHFFFLFLFFWDCKLKHDGTACVNRCCVATASLRPRPLPAGSHTEACRSICQDAAQAHP